MDLGGENECCLVDLAQQDIVPKTIRVRSLFLRLFAACRQTTSFTQNQIVIMLFYIYIYVTCLGSIVRHGSSFAYLFLALGLLWGMGPLLLTCYLPWEYCERHGSSFTYLFLALGLLWGMGPLLLTCYLPWEYCERHGSSFTYLLLALGLLWGIGPLLLSVTWALWGSWIRVGCGWTK